MVRTASRIRKNKATSQGSNDDVPESGTSSPSRCASWARDAILVSLILAAAVGIGEPHSPPFTLSFDGSTQNATAGWNVKEVINDLYVSFYQKAVRPFAAWRMAEPTLAVVSFGLSGSLFTLCTVLGIRKMKQPKSATKVQRGLGAVIATSAVEYVWWTALNVGIYIGVIELFQRLVMEPLDFLPLVFEEPPQLPPSFLRLVVEVAFSVWLYDFVFYWIHRSFHLCSTGGHRIKGDKKTAASSVDSSADASFPARLKQWWYSVHLTHHDHYEKTTDPLHVLVTFHHHILDASAQVGINIFVQQVPLAFLFAGSRHPMSKLLHNIVVTYLLVEAHSGYDLPFMSHRILPSVFGGAVRHQIHHDVGRKYYHQFFKYIDDIFFPEV